MQFTMRSSGSRARRVLVEVVAFAVALACMLTPALRAVPASAATATDDVTTSTPAARIATFSRSLESATSTTNGAIARRQTLTAQRVDTENRLTIAEVTYLQKLAAADDAVKAQAQAKADLQSVAVAIFRASDGTDAVLDAIAQGADPLEADRRRRLASYAGKPERKAWQATQDATKAAAAEVEVADGARRELRVRTETLTQDLATAERTEQNARVAATKARGLLDLWTSVQSGAGSPILDKARLSAADLASWYMSNRRVPRTTVPIETLAQIYIEEGARAGVRGDIAFAQSVLETAYFTFPDYGQVRPDDNNFAGIGACDSCANGRAYPDARTGVRAQIQLLRAYADRDVSEARLGAPAVDPKLTQLAFRGGNPTWASLTGRWATAAGYGDAVMAVYYRMLDWVTTRG